MSSGPAGRQETSAILERSIAWVWSVWFVHLVLRVAVLARPDAFGHDFVGKFGWYIFHAAAFDARWILAISLPAVAHVWFWTSRRPGWAAIGFWGLVATHSVLLVATVVDHELQRFMGARLTLSMAQTYNHVSSWREVFGFLLDDRGGVGIPLVLGAFCVPAAFALGRFLASRVVRPVRWSVTFFVITLVGLVYTEVLWGGANREKKLAPLAEHWIRVLKEQSEEPMDQATFDRSARRWSRTWLAQAGRDTAWEFPDPVHPLWRVPRGDSLAVPSQRWNVVLIVMESGRGLNCGFLRPYGAQRSATRFLDSVAGTGRVWARHICPSMPTVRALMAIHLGVPDHSQRNIATSFPGLAQRALPVMLRDHGWRTRFFSAADPSWDNQTPWLSRWYEAFDYSPEREKDPDMLGHAAQWMRDSLRDGRPFFVTLMTKSNHYPFDQNPAWRSEPDLQKRHLHSMRYMDSAIGVFVKSVEDQAWFSRTVFVVTGDHGFPLGEHGTGNMGFGLFDESTWVPLVIWGPHPDLTPGVSLAPSSHIDIAPTILHLAGARLSNHFAGHDLLASDEATSRSTWATHYDEVLSETSRWRAHGTLSGTPRERGPQIFRTDLDPLELSDSGTHAGPVRDSLLEEARFRIRLTEELLRRDALCPVRAPDRR